MAVDQSGRVVALSENGYSEITVSLPGTMLKASLVLSVSGSSSGGGGGGGGGSGGVPMPPVITSLSASSSTVTGVGIPVELSTTADGEASFSWRCLGEGCGDFVAADAASVLWRSPAVPGTYTLEVTANRNGLSARATINITVLTGSASVEVEADPG
ncbi:MAG: hypothetical protein CVV27_17915 [Candidatus Melainabacteria bacterium HGW-Melainabacteria-1]|nr:MAG: hypothetical protein CVV27_17915 [Candidatus Melainabacteria bacterium HGW-Melainabacteria-1]